MILELPELDLEVITAATSENITGPISINTIITIDFTFAKSE